MLLHASLTQQAVPIYEMAERAGIESAMLTAVGHVATLPLLLACGQRAAETIRSRSWAAGYCPVCAAWPTLAEMRGLARDRFLRCGRCASEWSFAHDACPFCGSREQAARSYLAPERDRESQRAVTCDGCHGYLKTLATLRTLSPAELLLRDLQTVELDLAALDSGYARPEQLGWKLSLRVEPAAREAGGWLRRWR
jgi:FdhE protein